MKQATKQKLQYWVENGNFSGHPRDTERFFDFIVEAYRNGDTSISLDEFSEVVGDRLKDGKIKAGFYTRYDEGVELLKFYDGEKYNWTE